LLDEFSNLRGLFVYTKEELSKETCMRIARFRSLDYLYLGIPPIDAENFKELMVLKNIKTLYLTTTINDDVLKYVAEFDALEHLHINNKNISEDGIYQLHSLQHLTFINLFGKIRRLVGTSRQNERSRNQGWEFQPLETFRRPTDSCPSYAEDRRRY
jgi:hypothetical protein